MVYQQLQMKVPFYGKVYHMSEAKLLKAFKWNDIVKPIVALR